MHFKPHLYCYALLLAVLLPVSTSAADSGVPQSADDICPLLVSETIPEVELTGMDGKPVSLSGIIKQEPTLLIVYRGGWCPYCSTHLGALAKLEPELLKLGIQIVAISPDKPEYLAEATKEHSLNYTLLSDSDLKAAKAFGLAFQLDAGTLKAYKGYGIDLEKRSGHDHGMLPVPAAYMVKPDGTITFSFVAPNYKIRADGDVLLAAARQLVSDKE